MYKINLSQEAVDFLKNKGKDIITVGILVTSSWCGKTYRSEVQTKTPKNTGSYEMIQVDGVTVYVDKTAVQLYPKGLNISLEGIWMLKTLHAEELK